MYSCPGPVSRPILHVSLQSYADWLQELREQGPKLLKQLPTDMETSVSKALPVSGEGVPHVVLADSWEEAFVWGLPVPVPTGQGC